MAVQAQGSQNEASNDGNEAVIHSLLERGLGLTDADAAGHDGRPRQETSQGDGDGDHGEEGQDKGKSVHGIDPMMNNTAPPAPERAG